MDNLIRRQDAIDALGVVPPVSDTWTDEFEIGRYQQWKKDVDALSQLPSAQPERKKGYWIDVDPHGDSGLAFECSECGEINLRESDYCPNCGADMRGEKKC